MVSTPPRQLSQRVGRAFFGSFGDLRPIQRQAIEPILNGGDALIRAGTGTGKTEAATAPLVERYLAQLDHGDGVTVLYISPTRALANDLLRRLTPVFDRLTMKIGVRHGERDDLKSVNTPSVLITTPESLDVLVGNKESALTSVQVVVLDEIHLLMNTQRGLQLAIALHRLELLVERRVQVVGLSATVANPEAVWQFFRPGTRTTVVTDSATSRELEHQIRINVGRAQLANLMSRLAVADDTKILIFTNSRRECDLVADELRVSSGFDDNVFAHHASLEKDERQRVERDFEERPRAICVATSTLELGIDIGDIDLIVLYGVPADWQSFMQRIGRGSRRRDTVQALCVVPEPPPEKLLRLRDLLGFQALEQQVRTEVSDAAEAFDLYGAAAQQLVSAIHGQGGGFLGINRLTELSAPWPHLDPQTITQLLDELCERQVLQRHPVYRRYGADDGLWELRRTFDVWSNLPLGSRDIEIVHGSHTLGKVPASNLLRLHENASIAFSGRRWTVTEVHADRIKVSPTQRAPTIELRYGRRGAPLDPSLTEQIRILIRDGTVGAGVVPSTTQEALTAELAPLRRYAADNVLPVDRGPIGVTYVTFAGSLANQIIAAWAHAAPSDATEFSVRSSLPIDFTRLPTDPRELLAHLDVVEVHDDELSQFQRALPVAQRRRELENEWLRRPCHAIALRRLASAAETPLSTGLLPLIDR